VFLKLAQFLGPSLRKRTQNSKKIFRHENEHLLKREIRINNKLQKADEYHKRHETQNINTIFFNYLPDTIL